MFSCFVSYAVCIMSFVHVCSEGLTLNKLIIIMYVYLYAFVSISFERLYYIRWRLLLFIINILKREMSHNVPL